MCYLKIDELKVNSYGKLKNKDIKFEDGINIIYGENEHGKSTLLNFIVNMFNKMNQTDDFEKLFRERYKLLVVT